MREATPPADILHKTSWRRRRATGVFVLEFKVREVHAAFVLSVKGEIDLATAPEFHRELERVTQNGRDVVVDLSQVGFMDLRGVRILEKFHNGMSKKHRRLVLCASSYPVHRIIELTELDKNISRYPSIEAALDSLGTR